MNKILKQIFNNDEKIQFNEKTITVSYKEISKFPFGLIEENIKKDFSYEDIVKLMYKKKIINKENIETLYSFKNEKFVTFFKFGNQKDIIFSDTYEDSCKKIYNFVIKL